MSLLQRYQDLEQRDRKALLWLGLFLAAVMIIYGMILPSYHYYQGAKNRFFDQGELLVWVQDNAATVKSAQQNKQSERPKTPLMQAVTGSVSRFGIEVNRLQPEGDKLRAWITKAPFGKSLQWLTELTRENGIEIEQISVEKTAKSGIVNIQCLLRPG